MDRNDRWTLDEMDETDEADEVNEMIQSNEMNEIHNGWSGSLEREMDYMYGEVEEMTVTNSLTDQPSWVADQPNPQIDWWMNKRITWINFSV